MLLLYSRVGFERWTEAGIAYFLASILTNTFKKGIRNLQLPRISKNLSPTPAAYLGVMQAYAQFLGCWVECVLMIGCSRLMGCNSFWMFGNIFVHLYPGWLNMLELENAYLWQSYNHWPLADVVLALGLRPIKLSFCPYFFFSQPGQRVKGQCTWGITSEIRRVPSVLRRKHCQPIFLPPCWRPQRSPPRDCHSHQQQQRQQQQRQWLPWSSSSPHVCCKSRNAQHQGKVVGSWSCSTSMSWKHSPDAVAECLTLPTEVPCRLGISNIRRTGRQKMGKLWKIGMVRLGLGCGSLGVLRDSGWLVGWLKWFGGSKLFGEVVPFSGLTMWCASLYTGYQFLCFTIQHPLDWRKSQIQDESQTRKRGIAGKQLKIFQEKLTLHVRMVPFKLGWCW